MRLFLPLRRNIVYKNIYRKLVNKIFLDGNLKKKAGVVLSNPNLVILLLDR